jgi:hypothetical protein
MSLTARFPVASLVCAALVNLSTLVGCADPTPPPGVPHEATPVTFSPHGGWAHCWLDAQMNVNRCRTYNWRGDRLYRAGLEHDQNDVFVRYFGTGPVPESELQIDKRLTQVDYVWLKNGVILLPQNAFDRYKDHIDKVFVAAKRGR